jgi:hypothetical protein
MDLELLVILFNCLVSSGLFIATLYRIKIEKAQVKVVIANAKSAEKLLSIRKCVDREREEIEKMSGKELMDFLEQVLKDENNS